MTVTPNFFIIGSLRSGTTALASYLLEHPEVFMPGTWEPNFLSTDLLWTNPPPVADDAGYLALFTNARGARRIGEKSSFYLYSGEAPNRIRSMAPDAKLICMLRDPLEMLLSLYRFNLANLEEDLVPFETALAAEPDRRAGRRIPSTGSIAQNLYYRELVRFGEQLDRYYALFPREQIHIILFDDLCRDVEAVFRETVSFLEISPWRPPEFERVNENERDLSHLEARRFLRTHPVLRKTFQAVVPLQARSWGKAMLRSVRGGEPGELSSIAEETRRRLCHEFRPELARLGELTGRDLSGWCRVD